jgi:hypothetical protein
MDEESLWRGLRGVRSGSRGSRWFVSLRRGPRHFEFLLQHRRLSSAIAHIAPSLVAFQPTHAKGEAGNYSQSYQEAGAGNEWHSATILRQDGRVVKGAA